MAKITLYTDDYNYDDADIIDVQKDLFSSFGKDEGWKDWEDVPRDMAIDDIEFNNQRLWEDVLGYLEKLFKNNYCVLSGNYQSDYPDFRPSGEGGCVITDLNEFYDFFEDCDYWTVEDEDGLLLIHASHHDGTLNVAVRVLTEAGVEWYKNYEYEGQIDTREEVETLFNSDKYSKKPYLAREMGYAD